MPTQNPRITFTLSQEMYDSIEDYRFTHRMKNLTQAIVSLLNLGLQSLSDAPKEQLPTFSKEEVHLVGTYRAADPTYQSVALELLELHPALKENLA